MVGSDRNAINLLPTISGCVSISYSIRLSTRYPVCNPVCHHPVHHLICYYTLFTFANTFRTSSLETLRIPENIGDA